MINNGLKYSSLIFNRGCIKCAESVKKFSAHKVFIGKMKIPLRYFLIISKQNSVIQMLGVV